MRKKAHFRNTMLPNVNEHPGQAATACVPVNGAVQAS